MGGMRAAKKKVGELLRSPDWRDHFTEIAAGGSASIGALFSFLLLDPLMKHRAAAALGRAAAQLAEEDPEKARNIARNYMWHMNEDSGNIGWGIPEAFAETLAQSPMLAKSFGNILLSYIMDLGHADNYCDNDILRRSCYWAVGKFAQANPQLAEKARSWLVKGLSDQDIPCRGYAAWALAQLPPSLADVPALKKLAQANDKESCEIFNGRDLVEKTVGELAREALQKSCGRE